MAQLSKVLKLVRWARRVPREPVWPSGKALGW